MIEQIQISTVQCSKSSAAISGYFNGTITDGIMGTCPLLVEEKIAYLSACKVRGGQ